jgi:hypothetical protein
VALNPEIKYGDIAIVFATLIGPVLAVQAQKWVERFRENRHRKRWIFETLMATRGARVSPEHVRALNMIELAFYGHTLFGGQRPSKKEKAVLNAWRAYLQHLNSPIPPNEGGAGVWNGTSSERFNTLLSAIAPDVGYQLAVEQIWGAYTPVAFGTLQMEQDQLRKLAIELLNGKRPLGVSAFPPPQPAQQQPAPQPAAQG